MNIQSINISPPGFQNLTWSLLVKLATPGEEPKMASNWPGDVYVLTRCGGSTGTRGANCPPRFCGIRKENRSIERQSITDSTPSRFLHILLPLPTVTVLSKRLLGYHFAELNRDY